MHWGEATSSDTGAKQLTHLNDPYAYGVTWIERSWILAVKKTALQE